MSWDININNSGYEMNSLQILSFVGFTLLVAAITPAEGPQTDTGSQQGYFLAGRSLKAPALAAASLSLTNRLPRNNWSARFRAGLQKAVQVGDGPGSDFSGDADLPRANLLPRYLKRGIATIPDFLEERCDKTTRIIIDFVFLIATGVCFLRDCSLPGRVGAQQPVSRRESLQISHGAAIWLLVILLGLAGILYADRRTARNGSGGLHQRYWAGYRRVDGAVVFRPDRDRAGGMRRALSNSPPFTPRKLNSIGGLTDPCRLARHLPV